MGLKKAFAKLRIDLSVFVHKKASHTLEYFDSQLTRLVQAFFNPGLGASTDLHEMGDAVCC